MHKRSLIIIGAGGFGREVLMYAEASVDNGADYIIKGFLDDDLSALDKYKYGYNVIDTIGNYEICNEDIFICAIGDVKVKKKVCIELQKRGAEFTNVIHPTAIIGKTTSMGFGNIFCPMSIITQNVKIGNFISINTSSSFGHDSKVGNYTTISGGCSVTGYAELGKGVFLGGQSFICPNVSIGDYARIGAGSVVIKNVKANSVVFGNPAVEIF